MKQFKKMITGSVAASMLVAGGLGMSSVATAGELSASAAISNMYLFRGGDLGNGSAAVSGDLIYTHDTGLYGGIWVSSGDTVFTGSQEYDYFAGWAGEVGGLGIDIGVINYNYSGVDINSNNAAGAASAIDDTTGELSEAYLLLSFAGVDLAYWDNIAGSSTYKYYSIGYSWDKYSVTYGVNQFDNTGVQTNYKTGVADPGTTHSGDNSHIDFTYAFNDSLSFTFSKIVDDDAEGTTNGVDDDLLIALSYSLPIE